MIWRSLRNADYPETLRRMREFTLARSSHTPDELWQVEHPAVYTLGQAGQTSHILDAQDTPVIQTERGGQVTYHGPGQVVIYTLIDLKRRGLFVKDSVCRLEQAIIDTLLYFQVQGAVRKPQAPGVYVPKSGSLAKIGAIGLKVSRGRAYHGLSLNVDMDLEPFQRINPCGYAGLETVDMATMGSEADWQSVADELCNQIEKNLSPDT